MDLQELALALLCESRKEQPASHGEDRMRIVVLNHGWVYVGRVSVCNSFVSIKDAKNLRYWGTASGLGQLAKDGPTDKTKMDDYGFVRAPLSSVNHMIDCEAGKW